MNQLVCGMPHPEGDEKIIPDPEMHQVTEFSTESSLIRDTVSALMMDVEQGRHESSSNSRTSEENINSELTDMFEDTYKWCKKKLDDSNLSLKKINGGYYYFYTGTPRLNWYQARDWCQARGMTLANLETPVESSAVMAYINQLLANEVGSDLQSFFWTGGNDLGTEGSFRWLTGNTINNAPWLLGQPDNSGGSENCVDIWRIGGAIGMNDRSCTAWQGRFVCEVQSPCKEVFLMVESFKKKKQSSSSGGSSEDGSRYV